MRRREARSGSFNHLAGSGHTPHMHSPPSFPFPTHLSSRFLFLVPQGPVPALRVAVKCLRPAPGMLRRKKVGRDRPLARPLGLPSHHASPPGPITHHTPPPGHTPHTPLIDGRTAATDARHRCDHRSRAPAGASLARLEMRQYPCSGSHPGTPTPFHRPHHVAGTRRALAASSGTSHCPSLPKTSTAIYLSFNAPAPPPCLFLTHTLPPISLPNSIRPRPFRCV